MVKLQSQPANTSVVKLHEFAVDFPAFVLVESALRVGAVCFLQIVENRFALLEHLAIGAARRFQLQDAHIDSHLNDIAPISSLNDSRVYS